MAEEKKQTENKDAEEIKDLGDEEEVGTKSKGFKLPIPGKLVVPIAIAAAAFLLSLAGAWFLTGPHSPMESTTAADSTLAANPDITDSTSHHTKAESESEIDLNNIDFEDIQDASWMRELFGDIDTTAVMKELGLLDDDTNSATAVDGMTPQDSIDTLNWIQKEMVNLARKKDSLDTRGRELAKLDKKVSQALIKIEQAETARVTELARLYDGMRPEEVARLFDNLSDDVIISILPRMKSANAAKILALMKPKRAAKISTEMITVMDN
ncbi:MAG: hypothetical protein JW763_08480 [candidate division Zixibacteria bacterium]|nr:hypothetical protein [candidate division Zixibacteria bacterium]